MICQSFGFVEILELGGLRLTEATALHHGAEGLPASGHGSVASGRRRICSGTWRYF